MNVEHQNIRELDPLYPAARQVVVDSQRPSISRIQCELRIGYNRAARLLEAMEGDVVTPADASGVRQMLGEKGGAA